jgi:hypothetical protein
MVSVVSAQHHLRHHEEMIPSLLSTQKNGEDVSDGGTLSHEERRLGLSTPDTTSIDDTDSNDGISCADDSWDESNQCAEDAECDDGKACTGDSFVQP